MKKKKKFNQDREKEELKKKKKIGINILKLLPGNLIGRRHGEKYKGVIFCLRTDEKARGERGERA